MFGHALVKGDRRGRLYIEGPDRDWPWADTPEHFDALFQQAEDRLKEAALEMGADAVIKVEGKITRDNDNRPEMVLIGTAVTLEREMIMDMEKEGKGTAEVKERAEGVVKKGDRNVDKGPVPAKGDVESNSTDGEVISVTVGGGDTVWTVPTATVEDRSGPRGRGMGGHNEGKKRLSDLASSLGISIDRARKLADSGHPTVEAVAEAGIRELSTSTGLNPTQARLLKEKARDLLSAED